MPLDWKLNGYSPDVSFPTLSWFAVSLVPNKSWFWLNLIYVTGWLFDHYFWLFLPSQAYSVHRLPLGITPIEFVLKQRWSFFRDFQRHSFSKCNVSDNWSTTFDRPSQKQTRLKSSYWYPYGGARCCRSLSQPNGFHTSSIHVNLIPLRSSFFIVLLILFHLSLVFRRLQSGGILMRILYSSKILIYSELVYCQPQSEWWVNSGRPYSLYISKPFSRPL